MVHLRGNESRYSKRAIEKKNRAKEKHFKISRKVENDAITEYSFNDPRRVGIVISSVSQKVNLLSEKGQHECTIGPEAPKRLAKALVPGDIVTLSEDEESLSITGITERKNVLSRMRRDSTRRSFVGAEEQVIAANVDVAVIVSSAQNPPFHPKFIDRYVILTQHNGITPVVCLNKSDLAAADELEKLQEYERLGIKTVLTSTVTNEGIEEFRDMLRGKAAVLVGHSGVGKTSLINAVNPTETYRTGEVSAKSGKGRHTTTLSSLHVWEEDSYIIDTPGIRSLEIWDIEKSELQYYYPEFAPYIPDCKYPDCLHQNEPLGSCAVKQVVGQPEGISRGRYESYLKILDEL